jgi:cell division protein FtsW
MLGIITNAARHEPEAVAALRAGREDRFNRLLRLPLPEPYVPTRLEAARDRLRTRPDKPAAAKPKPKPKPKPTAKGKPKPKAGSKAKPKPARKPAEDRRRSTVDAADRAAKGAGHHGGRQRQPGPRARSLEGQRYG